MISPALTKKAMKVAYEAHHGQTDRSGTPYIFHPFHVAEQMDDELSVCTALLHDVIEDTEITFEDLTGEFPEEVVEALRCLTRDKNMNYFDYIKIVVLYWKFIIRPVKYVYESRCFMFMKPVEYD